MHCTKKKHATHTSPTPTPISMHIPSCCCPDRSTSHPHHTILHDLIWQVLVAGTWGSGRHWHDLQTATVSWETKLCHLAPNSHRNTATLYTRTHAHILHACRWEQYESFCGNNRAMRICWRALGIKAIFSGHLCVSNGHVWLHREHGPVKGKAETTHSTFSAKSKDKTHTPDSFFPWHPSSFVFFLFFLSAGGVTGGHGSYHLLSRKTLVRAERSGKFMSIRQRDGEMTARPSFPLQITFGLRFDQMRFSS